VANARAEFASLIEAKARAALSRLVERGVIRPGGGRSFAGVVVFELREAAEWAGEWVPRPVTVTDVACATCGKAGARIVAEGETVDGGPVYCRTCRPAEEAKAKAGASSPAPAVAPPPVQPSEESVEDATWPRRSLT
jgi:predicted alpha-1,6-mannanase (GH76 family)